MFNKLRGITLIATLVVILIATTVVSAVPLAGYRTPCPSAPPGTTCTGCVSGGGYFCTTNGTIVNYSSSCVQLGSALVCTPGVCHCMPVGTSDHCCSSHNDCP